jgi:hypothetical protein
MTRRFFAFSVLTLWLGQIPLFAEATNTALAASGMLENDVMYLRVGQAGKNLAAEIRSAQNDLAMTNKIAGTVLDLRFAGGDDSDAAKKAADLLAGKKLPLVILVDDETRGAAASLAAELRSARAGLIFGSSTEIKPDIAVTVKSSLTTRARPTWCAPKSKTATRMKTPRTSRPGPAKPVIRDPVLARAVDLIKASRLCGSRASDFGLTIGRSQHNFKSSG